MLGDVRIALRSFLKTPGFFAIAVLTLALGAGANTVLFSAVNALLLRPLPYPDSERLAIVWGRQVKDGRERQTLSREFYEAFTRSSAALESAGAVSPSWSFVVRVGGSPEQVQGYWATGTFLQTFGLAPRSGRLILPSDDRAGAPPVALVSERFWARAFGDGTALAGQTLEIDGAPVPVVGIVPDSFRFLDDADVWMPLALNPVLARPNGPTIGLLNIVARHAPGASVERLDTDARVVAERLSSERPVYANISATAVPLQRDTVSGVRPGLLAVTGAVGFVLLIACANIVNLLLTRAAGRSRDLAIRLAVGATRGRLLRFLFAEGFVISATGTALGTLLAWWCVGLLASLPPELLPRASEITLDAPVLIATVAMCGLMSLAFALAPALHAPARALGDSLKSGGRSVGAGSRLRDALVVAEVALSLVLLVGAGLLMRSFVRVMNVDPGFVASGLLTFQVSVPAKYATAETRQALLDALFERLESLPGVVRAGGSTRIPLRSGVTTFLDIEGRTFSSDARPEVEFRRASSRYFEAMGIPLLRGRAFSPADRADARRVAIVNRRLAERHFAGVDPVGQRIRFFQGDPQWWTIVGVVGDVRQFGLEAEAPPEVYMHFAQGPPTAPIIAVRTQGDAAAATGAVRQALREVEPDLVVWNMSTMDGLVAESVARRRMSMQALAGFSALALLLASIGIYGVLSYFVHDRRREIGVRLALGAPASSVVRLVLGRAAAMTALGIGLGLLGAVGLARVIGALLYGVRPLDPVTLASVIGVLSVVALAASYLPARRAMAVDPLVALRTE